MYKTSIEKQAVKFVPEGDGAAAMRIFRSLWPDKYKGGKLTFKLADRTLVYNGQAFVLRFKKVKVGRDKKGLKHELNRSLEVFNMVLTMRLPVYAYPEFRLAVRKVQDDMGYKFVHALLQSEGLADQLPEAKHSAKWGYANALLDPVNKPIKEKK